MFCRTATFKYLLLPYVVKDWNKLDSIIRNAKTRTSYQKMLLNFIRPKGNSTCKIYDPLGIKLFTRLQVGFSHISGKFRHNFADSLNPLCSCYLKTETIFETTIHFLYAS